MNVNIYLEDELAKDLDNFTKKLGRKRNSIIREAISNWLVAKKKNKWPRDIMNFKGDKSFPSIDELRRNIDESDKELF